MREVGDFDRRVGGERRLQDRDGIWKTALTHHRCGDADLMARLLRLKLGRRRVLFERLIRLRREVELGELRV
jgi:hypothetical protein